jgi:hypothetical protein
MLKNIPIKRIIMAGAAVTGGVYALGRVARYRGERLAAGESDPLAFSNDWWGGGSAVVAGAIAVGSSVLLKGQARMFGYAAAAGALLPVGQAAIAKLEAATTTTDHYLLGGSAAQVDNSRAGYYAASRNLSDHNMLAARALAS